MRYLTLIRHAKAQDPAAWDDDYDRPLSERGIKDALVVAKVLTNLQPPINYWLSSSAQRTRETTNLLIETLDQDMGDAHFADEAYLATAKTLLELAQSTHPAVEHVALVGHNPGLEELTAALCAGDARHFNFRLPTAAFAHIELQIARWDQLRPGSGELRYLLAPKLLRK